MLIVTIVFCYSVIAPLIVPFGALYFGLGWLILRNQALKVYVPSYESYGRMWPHIHNRILASLILYQVTMLGYFGVQKFYYAPFFIPLSLLLILFGFVCTKKFYPAFEWPTLEVTDSKFHGSTGVVNLAGIPISTRWSSEIKTEIKQSRIKVTSKRSLKEVHIIIKPIIPRDSKAEREDIVVVWQKSRVVRKLFSWIHLDDILYHNNNTNSAFSILGENHTEQRNRRRAPEKKIGEVHRARKRVVKRYNREKQRSLDWKIRAASLPCNATFFLTYVALKFFVGYGLELSGLVPLILFHLKKKYLCKTDAEVKEAWAPGDLGYGTRVLGDMLIVTIVFCYSVIAPLIVPFGALYFGLGWLILRNQALKVYVPSYESYGRMWPHIHNRILASLILYQVTMLGYFGVQKFYYAPFFIPLSLLLILFGFVCTKKFYPAFEWPTLEVTDMKDFPGIKIAEESEWKNSIQGSTGVVNLAGISISTRWSSEIKTEIKQSRIKVTSKQKYGSSVGVPFLYISTEDIVVVWQKSRVVRKLFSWIHLDDIVNLIYEALINPSYK
ncbi:hypothetical protein S245_039830, partial [Arachis hypogaea]